MVRLRGKILLVEGLPVRRKIYQITVKFSINFAKKLSIVLRVGCLSAIGID